MAQDGRLVPVSFVQKLSQDRMELPPGVGPPDWRHDPSYFWREQTLLRRKLKQCR